MPIKTYQKREDEKTWLEMGLDRKCSKEALNEKKQSIESVGVPKVQRSLWSDSYLTFWAEVAVGTLTQFIIVIVRTHFCYPTLPKKDISEVWHDEQNSLQTELVRQWFRKILEKNRISTAKVFLFLFCIF